ncbi:MAG: ABC transporter permease [Pseudomonadota bacterium]
MAKLRLTHGLAFGAILTAVFILIAFVSFFWTPYSVEALNIAQRLLPASAGHILGTDHFGRDIASMLMVGARISLAVAIGAVVIGMGVGVPAGLLAAARRGHFVDDFVMRGNDLIFAFPALLTAVLIAAVFGPSVSGAVLAIGIFNIPVFARVTRASALAVWTQDFILAARVAGKGAVRISIEHVLPNIAGVLIVQGTIQFSLGILAEAGLSYVGLGAQAPMPSWGRMLADSQTMIAFAPHLAFLPGFAIIMTVLGLNLLGDGLRDWLDPRLRRGRS